MLSFHDGEKVKGLVYMHPCAFLVVSDWPMKREPRYDWLSC